MQTRQTIAIIGASGNMGSAISRSLAKGNFRLLLESDKPDDLVAIITEIKNNTPSADVEQHICSMEACWEADIIILAIRYEAEPGIAEKIREVANQKIVISIANPLDTYKNGLLTSPDSGANASNNGLISHPDSGAADQLQRLLPNSKIVKVFDITFAAELSNVAGNGIKMEALLTGNDEESLETAAGILRLAGFNPVIAGDKEQHQSINKIFSFKL